MKTWFLQLTRREQLYLMVMAGAVGLWLLMVVAVLPLAESRTQMTRNNAAAGELLARVDAKVNQLLNLRKSEGARQSGSLSATITRTSELAGLSVRRLQPNSRGEVQVRFESVDYDALVRYLHTIEVTEGLVVLEASITQGGRAGGVNATLRLAQPG
jgi:type II secretory pathway component PulM